MGIDTTDPFSTRPGYIPGRCNAWRHLAGHPPHTDGLCKRYPMKGKRRCHRHGGRGTGGGWLSGRPRKPVDNRTGTEKRIALRMALNAAERAKHPPVPPPSE